MKEKLTPINGDTYLCEEITEGFKVINGLKRREREGTPEFVNFSNLVRVLSVKEDNSYGLKVGDVLMVTHFVATQKLSGYLVVYDEDIFAKLDEGGNVLDVNDYLSQPFGHFLCKTYRKHNKMDNGLEWISDESSKVAIEVGSGALVEYNKSADYEVFLNGIKYFVVDKTKAFSVGGKLQNSYVIYNDSVICRKGDIKTSSLIKGERYVKKNQILGRVPKKTKNKT